jgi:hypothetical protein
MAQAFLKRTSDSETKLSYALKRVLTRVQSQAETVQQRLTDIDIDHCLTEQRNGVDVIVRDGAGALQYTREAMKLRNAEQASYLNGDNLEIEPHLATKLPDDLNMFEVEAFEGFVISAEDAARLQDAIEAKAGATSETVKAANV